MAKSAIIILCTAVVLVACTTTKPTATTATKTSGVEAVQKSVWDKSYGGADKSYDTRLLALREEVSPRFKTLAFTDPKTGDVMMYNLFVPKNYDPSKKYPLVLFMADGSTTGKGAMAPLKQGYGGIIWVTDEEQAKHPSFVLVPAFKGPENVVNDKWEVSQEVDTVVRLLDQVVSDYSIDKNRLYTTGQSMGGMISFYLNANHPDLFAASLFVASQWDIKVLEPLVKQKFFYIVSAADPKASVGMKEVGTMLMKKHVGFAETTFAADLAKTEQDVYIQKLLSQGKHINFVQFTAGTVAPTQFLQTGFKGAEHMYSFDHAYLLEGVRDWLFKQRKETPEQTAAAQAFELGLTYFNGLGVAKDYTKAEAYFKQAMQQGHMKAPRYLGIMAEEGLGELVDYTKAKAYYKTASNAGDITAAARIGWLYERGLGVKKSAETALQWYLKAAPTPDIAATNVHPRVLALSRLGYFYETGTAVKRDINEAKHWYNLAAQDNDPAALAALKRLNP